MHPPVRVLSVLLFSLGVVAHLGCSSKTPPPNAKMRATAPSLAVARSRATPEDALQNFGMCTSEYAGGGATWEDVCSFFVEADRRKLDDYGKWIKRLMVAEAILQREYTGRFGPQADPSIPEFAPVLSKLGDVPYPLRRAEETAERVKLIPVDNNYPPEQDRSFVATRHGERWLLLLPPRMDPTPQMEVMTRYVLAKEKVAADLSNGEFTEPHEVLNALAKALLPKDLVPGTPEEAMAKYEVARNTLDVSALAAVLTQEESRQVRENRETSQRSHALEVEQRYLVESKFGPQRAWEKAPLRDFASILSPDVGLGHHEVVARVERSDDTVEYRLRRIRLGLSPRQWVPEITLLARRGTDGWRLQPLDEFSRVRPPELYNLKRLELEEKLNEQLREGKIPSAAAYWEARTALHEQARAAAGLPKLTLPSGAPPSNPQIP